MIEYVIDIRAQLNVDALSKMEVLVEPQVHSPGSGPPQHVSLGDACLGENVRPYRRQPERQGIPDLVTALLVEIIAERHRTEGWLNVKITYSVQRGNPDVAGLDGIAIVASPEGRKARS